jgi:hypothetical protein
VWPSVMLNISTLLWVLLQCENGYAKGNNDGVELSLLDRNNNIGGNKKLPYGVKPKYEAS